MSRWIVPQDDTCTTFIECRHVSETKGIMLIVLECPVGLQVFGERVLALMRTTTLALTRHREGESKLGIAIGF